jgi:hypothetical protein
MFSRAVTVTYPTKHTPKALFTPLCPRLLVCQGQGDYVFMHFSPSFLPFLAVRVAHGSGNQHTAGRCVRCLVVVLRAGERLIFIAHFICTISVCTSIHLRECCECIIMYQLLC